MEHISYIHIWWLVNIWWSGKRCFLSNMSILNIYLELQGCNLPNLGRYFEHSKHFFANSHLVDTRKSCWDFVASRFMTCRAISLWTIVRGKKPTFLWCKNSNQKSGTFQGVLHLTPCMYICSYARRVHTNHIDGKPHIFNVSNFILLWELFNSVCWITSRMVILYKQHISEL